MDGDEARNPPLAILPSVGKHFKRPHNMQTMKYMFRLLFFFIPLIGLGQTTNSLSEILWSRVKSCHSMFEDMDEDGIPDFDKIDDSKNGYLKISGSWPTCGCSCSSTVGAYKNQEGIYVILQSDKVLCSWERKISSNKVLKEILPSDFGINSFISQQIIEKPSYPVLFLDFEIPQIGTDTKVMIELVPFGLKPDGNEIYCFEYKENNGYNNCKSIYRIRDIAKDIKDLKTLDYLLTGDFDKITPTDNNIVQKAIGDDDSRFRSKEEIQRYLIELKKVYDIYLKLETTELILGWNRQDSRFYVKNKGGKTNNLTFKDFLIKNKYWSPMC